MSSQGNNVMLPFHGTCSLEEIPFIMNESEFLPFTIARMLITQMIMKVTSVVDAIPSDQIN